MQKIWKYEIPLSEKFKIDMPRGMEIVKIDAIDGTPYMWVLFWDHNESNVVEYEFALAPTGGDIGDDYIYAGTFIIGAVVFHLLEFHDDIPF